VSDRLAGATCDSPIDELILVGSAAGLREIRWKEQGLPPGAEITTCAVLDDAAQQLGAYFAGELMRFELPLDLVGTPFQLQAWRALADVPFGTTMSYGEQARRLGRPGAARAVGAANGRNPVPIVLPCHRLVGADRSLVGFGGGLDRKTWLLEHEARVAAG
jgi:methylated-DNA-[protein]-cysteine S-methyltransferase